MKNLRRMLWGHATSVRLLDDPWGRPMSIHNPMRWSGTDYIDNSLDKPRRSLRRGEIAAIGFAAGWCMACLFAIAALQWIMWAAAR